ncbi:MAG: (d)CMP kinase [Thermodesulfobacteriota bacterium]
MKPLLITIDGPAGAGKTTASRLLADALGYRYIDTGALYRGIAVAVKSAGIEPDDDTALETLCSTLALQFKRNDAGVRLLLNQQDISDQIRTPEISMLASAVSARPVVRKCLLGLQREMGREKNAVFEGRDMGTVVFPDADVKFYLDASLKTRAIRRFRELKPEVSQSLEAVAAEMERRDKNDSTRQVAPLKPATDAVIIDSTDLTAEAVVQLMRSHIMKRQ